MSHHTDFLSLRQQAAECIKLKESVKPSPLPPVVELTEEEKYAAKHLAQQHKHVSTISNARKAISYIQSRENLEQAKLFVRSLQQNY